MGVRYEEHDGDEKKNYRYYWTRDPYRSPNGIFIDFLNAGRSCYLYALMGCDSLDYRKSSRKYACAVVAFSEKGDQVFPSDRSDYAVGQNALEPVPHLDAVFPVLHRDRDQYPVVFAFPAEFPLFRCPQGETLDIFSIEALYREDEHLC